MVALRHQVVAAKWILRLLLRVNYSTTEAEPESYNNNNPIILTSLCLTHFIICPTYYYCLFS